MNTDTSAITTVLAVDDSEETLDFLTEVLRKASMSVFAVTSGADALNILQSLTPDIIIIDAVMPEMNGFETCRRIKSHARFLDIPVIFLMGLGRNDHIAEAFRAGGTDYITKPIIAREIVERILVHSQSLLAVRQSGVAIDAAKQAPFTANDDGYIVWSTARAKNTLGKIQSSEGAALLPADVVLWLRQRKSNTEAPDELTFLPSRLKFSLLAPLSQNEFLLAVSPASESGAMDFAALREYYKLTQRETQVLQWLAKGKSNKDIGAILKVSTRTIEKYLEQILAKLGVENRTAAAAIALAALNGTERLPQE